MRVIRTEYQGCAVVEPFYHNHEALSDRLCCRDNADQILADRPTTPLRSDIRQKTNFSKIPRTASIFRETVEKHRLVTW